MRIGLVDVDCHAKKKKRGATVYPNLALMKISAWHKSKGDTVEWYSSFGSYDVVYMSKIFNFTPDFPYVIRNAGRIVKGGTGYSLTVTLPDDIDRTQPDYSIYPALPKDVAYGFLTRGCPNKCPWCVVPRKEGGLYPYMDVDEVATPERRKLILMDNNFLAAGDYSIDQLHKIIERDYRVDFNQAIDARLVDTVNAPLLAKVHWLYRRIRFGCDTTKQIEQCERAMRLIDGYGYRGEYFIYCMITDDFKESYQRIMFWWEINQRARESHSGNQVYPYAQPYRDPDKRTSPIPQWQKDLASWTNKKMCFETCSFGDFQPRKDFRCQKYIDMYL